MGNVVEQVPRVWWRALAENKVLRWGLGLGVMALSVWLLNRELDWDQVRVALRQVNYAWVGLGVAAIVGTFFARSWRWQALLWRGDLALWPTMTALLVGEMVSMALPVMRSGDVTRAVWISPQPGTNASEALGSVALEKVWDLLALLICGLVVVGVTSPLAGSATADWVTRSTWSAAVMLLVGSLALWVGLRWKAVWFRGAGRILAYFPAGWDRALLPKLHSLAHGLTSIQNPQASARVLGWTLVKWGLGAVANWAVMVAFGVTSMPAAILLLAGLMVGGAIVPTPGRLGIFEAICVLCLTLFAVPYDTALAIGLVLHVVVMGPPLVVGAGLALWSQSVHRRGDEPI